MKRSLFTSLVSYLPSQGRDPKEDYLTQLFAWILENIPDVAKSYVMYLCGKAAIPCPNLAHDEIEISTQETVPSGRIDLLIRIPGKIGFICEHKVFSSLSEDQIEKYMKDAHVLGHEKYHSVLVTYSVRQHTQPAEVSLIWRDIDEFVECLPASSSREETFVLEQFRRYLKEHNMEKAEKITQEALGSYWSVMQLQENLDMMFGELATFDFTSECEGIEQIGEAYSPVHGKLRWGRLGIDFFPRWNRGLFAGVLLNTADHKLEPKDPAKGPDLVVFLESEYARDGENRLIYDENTASRRYIKLCEYLKANRGEFDFLPGIPESPWRIAVLRKPLADVLNGKETYLDQYEAVKQTVIDAIKLIIAGLRQG